MPICGQKKCACASWHELWSKVDYLFGSGNTTCFELTLLNSFLVSLSWLCVTCTVVNFSLDRSVVDQTIQWCLSFWMLPKHSVYFYVLNNGWADCRKIDFAFRVTVLCSSQSLFWRGVTSSCVRRTASRTAECVIEELSPVLLAVFS